jgi:hypothetical protein
MMSHYANYIKEKDGIETIETPVGFITYKFLDDGKTVYIFDCYIRPESRGKKMCKNFVTIVEWKAKNRGYTTNLTSVQIIIPNASKNIKTYLGYGYQIIDAKDGVVYLSKEIK